MTVYDLYGLDVASDVVLPAPRSPRPAPPDLEVRRLRPARIGPAVPRGELVAEMTAGGRRWYTATIDGHDVYRLRFPGMLDLGIRERQIELRTDPDALPGLDAVLLAGTGLAFGLAVRGEPVLHASAVELDGGAVALIGASGGGKSTVAALACAGGAALVTDDVLRLTRDAAACWRGTQALRLREATRPVHDLFDPPVPISSTPDGRYAISPPATVDRLLPLRATMFTVPDRTVTRVEIESLAASDTVAMLARTPRIFGWSRPQDLLREFKHQTAVARAAPAYVLRIPWSQPFDRSLVDELVTRLADVAVSVSVPS